MATVSGKIFEALTTIIKVNDSLKKLAEDVKELAEEIKDVDRRLVRVETYIEIAEKQRRIK